MTWSLSGYGHGTGKIGPDGDEREAESAFREAARQLKERGHRVDSLVLNGRTLFSGNEETPEG